MIVTGEKNEVHSVLVLYVRMQQGEGGGEV